MKRLSIFLFLIFASLAAFMTGCVTQTPVPQYAENYQFAVAYTHDDTADLTSKAVKDSTIAAINDVLVSRNLRVTPISFSAIEPQMNAIRDTDRRVQALKASASGASIILLTEISTEFYSALSGRYRWDVSVHISIYDVITREILKDKFTVPAALMYAHENGDDAIDAVKNEIEHHMGGLVDAFLKGRTNHAATEAVVAAPAPAPVRVAREEVEPAPAVEESAAEDVEAGAAVDETAPDAE